MPAQITSIAKAVKAAPEFLERYGLDRAITGRNVLGRGQFAVVVGPPSHPEIAVKFTVDDDDAAIAQMVLDAQEERGRPIPGIVEILEVVRFADDVRGKALNQRIARAIGKEHLTEYTDATLYAVVMERVLVEDAMPPERRWSNAIVRFELQSRPWWDATRSVAPGQEVPYPPLSAEDQRLLDHLVDGYATLAEMGYELGDIRSANIGWSVRRQQFVLFDFGVYHFSGAYELDPDALPLARNAGASTERGIRALVLAMSPRIEEADALDFGRNVAGLLGDLRVDESVYGVLVDAMRGRRKNWPNKVWGSLSDTEIDDLAAVASDAWSSTMLTANTRSVLRRTKASFDRHFDEAANRFPDIGTVELHHDEAAGGDNGHGSERQFGFCEDDHDVIRISFANKIESLPQENIDGLVAHEFGHALDFRYGKRDLERMLRIRLPDGAERRADAIAGAVFGKTIRYDEALVQCVSCKGQSPRPKRLGP